MEVKKRVNRNIIPIEDVGRRRGERKEERRNTVGPKHTLTPKESINISHRKGRRVAALGNR